MLKKKSKKKYFTERYGNDLFFRRNIYDVTVKNIEKGSHVLDLGCASGHIGAYLKDHLSCKVLAVDMDEENVELSKKRGVNTILGDLETDECLKRLVEYTESNTKFDNVICTEIIEHLKSPELFLEKLKQLIKTNGKVIISTPNIAFWNIRLKLLFGNFDYKEIGILDETHLRFFTNKTFRNLLLKKNYEIIEFHYLYTHYQDLGFYIMRIIPFAGKFFKSIFKGLLTYQMLAVVKLKN